MFLVVFTLQKLLAAHSITTKTSKVKTALWEADIYRQPKKIPSCPYHRQRRSFNTQPYLYQLQHHRVRAIYETQTLLSKIQINHAPLPLFRTSAPTTSLVAVSYLHILFTVSILAPHSKRTSGGGYQNHLNHITNNQKRNETLDFCKTIPKRFCADSTISSSPHRRRWAFYAHKTTRYTCRFRGLAACASPEFNSRSFWPPHITAKAIITTLLAAVAAIRSPSRCIAVA